MPWLGRLVAGLSLRASGFDSKQVEVRLSADEVSFEKLNTYFWAVPWLGRLVAGPSL